MAGAENPPLRVPATIPAYRLHYSDHQGHSLVEETRWFHEGLDLGEEFIGLDGGLWRVTCIDQPTSLAGAGNAWCEPV